LQLAGHRVGKRESNQLESAKTQKGTALLPTPLKVYSAVAGNNQNDTTKAVPNALRLLRNAPSALTKL
jgi:hypothetical protein